MFRAAAAHEYTDSATTYSCLNFHLRSQFESSKASNAPKDDDQQWRSRRLSTYLESIEVDNRECLNSSLSCASGKYSDGQKRRSIAFVVELIVRLTKTRTRKKKHSDRMGIVASKSNLVHVLIQRPAHYALATPQAVRTMLSCSSSGIDSMLRL